LKRLNLSNNDLSESVNIEDHTLIFLGELKELKHLYLANNKLKRLPDSIGNLKKT